MKYIRTRCVLVGAIAGTILGPDLLAALEKLARLLALVP